MAGIGRVIAPRLVGRRVRLEPFEARHITDRYIGWLNDPVVNAYSRRLGKRTSTEDAHLYMSALRPDEHVLAIVTEADGHVGNVKYGPIDWRNACADISILIGDPSVWGRGIGAEAVHIVSRYLFKDLGLSRVHADSYNPAFLKMVAKLGWKVEGVLRERVRLGEDLVDDTVVSLLAREFKLIGMLDEVPSMGVAGAKGTQGGSGA